VIAPKSAEESTEITICPVADTPSFAISRTPGFGYPLREGIEVSLKCDVDSNPPSTPRWQKDDGDTPVSWAIEKCTGKSSDTFQSVFVGSKRLASKVRHFRVLMEE